MPPDAVSASIDRTLAQLEALHGERVARWERLNGQARRARRPPLARRRPRGMTQDEWDATIAEIRGYTRVIRLAAAR